MGMNPETNDVVFEKKNEKENENDSDDAYLVNELTEAFTKISPFASPHFSQDTIEGWMICQSLHTVPKYQQLTSKCLLRPLLTTLSKCRQIPGLYFTK